MSQDQLPGGGGMGGGGNDREVTTDDRYAVIANEISLIAVPPRLPSIPAPSAISIVAGGLDVDGTVDVRGSQGVRVTAGPPVGLPAGSDSVMGVEVVTGPLGSITLQRGLLPVDQKIEMTPAGIKINAGSMPVTIESLTGITLSVAGGMTKIHLGPEGVTIEGLTVKIDAVIQSEVKGLLASVQADILTQVKGMFTMIG